MSAKKLVGHLATICLVSTFHWVLFAAVERTACSSAKHASTRWGGRTKGQLRKAEAPEHGLVGSNVDGTPGDVSKEAPVGAGPGATVVEQHWEHLAVVQAQPCRLVDDVAADLKARHVVESDAGQAFPVGYVGMNLFGQLTYWCPDSNRLSTPHRMAASCRISPYPNQPNPHRSARRLTNPVAPDAIPRRHNRGLNPNAHPRRNPKLMLNTQTLLR
ncbi:hypothetical protein H257_11121 [Aphanomyces astaci]|uniref:Secreted protein n=1 Tax=Aphanomyces astaci TaxID=112090 RepID=W4G3A0_APHAT|nr:hypothetical protein H257_11121 [Aphanomyces astaci]ETV74155.1 hypothetical protein H257_11121 [Aphanomyces astaci]|eukprot:XP_009836261.1 hypothetical protein H257_11121 [Aphanomyces astaci]